MAEMVQAVLAGDVTEAEELQELLRHAGIESEIAPDDEDDGLKLLVPADKLEAAQDAIEALTESDDA